MRKGITSNTSCMKAFLHFILLIFPLFVLSQKNKNDSLGNIHGSISTADGQPAANVNVLIKNPSIGTVTNADGTFEIRKMIPGNYTLLVSLQGYKPTEIIVTVNRNETFFLMVMLNVEFVDLTNVNMNIIPALKYVEVKPSESLRLNIPLIEIPQNIVVVTHQLLADQGLLSLTEAIRNVSGVQKTHGELNEYSLNIRGTDATWNVFRNGIGGYWWNQQEDVAMLEKTEFVKGPAGFMISVAEPGGIINNVTKQPTKKPIASINAGFGSYNLLRLTSDIGNTVNKKGTLLYRFNAGFQYQQRDFQFGNASRYFLCAALKYEPNTKTSVTAEYNNMYGRTAGNNDGLPSVNGKIFALSRNFAIADANSDTLISKDNYYRIQLKHSFNDSWNFNAQVSYVQGAAGGNKISGGAANSLSDDLHVANDTFYRAAHYDHLRNYSGAAQVFVDGQFYTGHKIDHKVLLGIDLCNKGATEHNSGTSEKKKYGLYLPNPQYYVSPERNFDIDEPFWYYTTWAAIYMQDHIKIGGKLVITLAGHLTYSSDSTSDYGQSNKNRTSYSAFTPRAGLTWLFSDDLSVYALYDQCFLPQFGKIFLPQKIDPFTGYNMEAGIKGYIFNKKLGLNISFFNIVKNHTLTPDREHHDYVIERGQITSRGIDLDLNGNITPAFSTSANYSYTNATITKDTDPNNIGTRNFGTPEHYGNCWLKYKLLSGKLKDISFAMGYQYMGRRSAIQSYNPDPATRFLPEYNLLDAAISYSNNKFNISLNVYNITNINYVTFGYFNADIKEWRYTPGEPVNFRVNFGMNLQNLKKQDKLQGSK
jgi:iron complex outermembrane receptor protein